MRRALAFATVFLLLGQSVALAQLKPQRVQSDFGSRLRTPTTGSPLVGWLGLDPSKFQMHQSYTLSFASVGGHTFSQGLYLNTMTYRFSPKLVAQLQLGMLHQPLGGVLGSSTLGNRFFVSGAQVIFRPSKNVQLHFQYGAYPYGYYGYQGYDYYYERLHPGWYSPRARFFDEE